MNLGHSSTEPAVRHVVLHDLDRVWIGDLHPTDLIESHHVPMADKANLPSSVVVEKIRATRLAARDQDAIRRHFAERVGFSGSSRAKLDEVVVLLDEWNEATEQQQFEPLFKA